MATVTFTRATRTCPGATSPAVDKLHLTSEDGKILVVGSSGSGKDTALRMPADLEPVDEGRIPSAR